MEAPGAYDPPAKPKIARGDLHPFLQRLMKDHDQLKAALNSFEETIHEVRRAGVSREANIRLGKFFSAFDNVFLPHDRLEEKKLFPLLEQKLLEKGEYSPSGERMTAVRVMEEEHIRAVQMAAVVLNFLGLASRLADEVARQQVLDAALAQAEELVELFRLHIFREDEVLFPLAHEMIDRASLDRLLID